MAAELLHADLVDRNAVPGQPKGREGDLWAARSVRTAFPDLRFAIDVAFEHDDLVTGRWTMTGNHTGSLELLGLPPTGEHERSGDLPGPRWSVRRNREVSSAARSTPPDTPPDRAPY